MEDVTVFDGQMTQEPEELDDIRAYDEAKASPEEFIPFEQAVEEIRRRRAGNGGGAPRFGTRG